MQAVLNFGKTEKRAVKEFLASFPEKEIKSRYEEAKAIIEGCIVTLYTSGKLLIQGKEAEKAKEKILAGLKLGDELILGIDETGRGESYGPFVVAGALGYTSRLRELRDSKKTKKIADKALLAKKNALAHEIVSVSAAEIDALRESGKSMNQIQAWAVNKIINEISKKHANLRIVVDGSRIKGVDETAEFIVGADDSIPQVGAASVIARAERDASPDREKRMSWKNQGRTENA